jgi:hypothetical protein
MTICPDLYAAKFVSGLIRMKGPQGERIALRVIINATLPASRMADHEGPFMNRR